MSHDSDSEDGEERLRIEKLDSTSAKRRLKQSRSAADTMDKLRIAVCIYCEFSVQGISHSLCRHFSFSMSAFLTLYVGMSPGLRAPPM